MALYDVVDLINTDFIASGVPCTIKFGPDHIAAHNDAPRIVVVPTNDSYIAAQYISPSAVYNTMIDGLNPRTILTRVEGATATIWAAGAAVAGTLQERADYVALHALINQFVLSLHRVNPGNYEVTGGKQINATRAVRRGFVYELEFTVQVPIIDIPWTTELDVVQDSTVELIDIEGDPIAEIEF
jgi:hypothetical protein